jgi:hypothetical protein
MFATIFAALLVGHYLGDYFVQTDYQAQHKGQGGTRFLDRLGRWNCAKHAVTYTATLAGVLGAALFVEGVEYNGRAALVVWSGLILNGLTHYIIDRRWTLEAAMRLSGKGGWIDADREALPKLDQAAHIVILGVVALAMAALI